MNRGSFGAIDLNRSPRLALHQNAPSSFIRQSRHGLKHRDRRGCRIDAALTGHHGEMRFHYIATRTHSIKRREKFRDCGNRPARASGGIEPSKKLPSCHRIFNQAGNRGADMLEVAAIEVELAAFGLRLKGQPLSGKRPHNRTTVGNQGGAKRVPRPQVRHDNSVEARLRSGFRLCVERYRSAFSRKAAHQRREPDSQNGYQRANNDNRDQSEAALIRFWETFGLRFARSPCLIHARMF